MAEFEELKIKVSFADDASEKLKEANTQLSKIATGGETSKKTVEALKQSTDLSSKLATELRGVASAFKIFGDLPIFKLGAGAGFAGILLAIKQTNDALGGFAKEMLALRDMSRSAGLLPDQFKGLTNQLKTFGYSTDEANREITGFVRHINEAARPGTAEYLRIYEASATPEVAMNLVSQMNALIRSNQPARALTLAKLEAQRIYDRELKRPGRGMQDARRQAESWLSTVGLSLKALGLGDISDLAGDPQKWQRRIEAAERFNREYEAFNKVLGGITTEIKLELLPAFQELNAALATGGQGFSGFISIISSDIEDFRKILALMEGDYEKFRTLLPVGGLLRKYMDWYLEKGQGTTGEVQGPPTGFGEGPKSPQGAPLSQLQTERLERLKGVEDARENNYYGNLLLEELKRLAFNLSRTGAEGNAAAKAPGAEGNPAFHNAPQGGAEGESNPMQLPAGFAQPGGGAAAEAVQSPRDETRSRIALSMTQAMSYLGKNESKHAADLKDYMQTGGRNLTGDNNAWCARFVDSIQTRAGLPSLESSLPEGQRSGQKDDRTWSSLAYKNWGRGVEADEAIREGDVFVKQRAGGGHVGTATGNYRLNAKGEREYEMLSGNIGGAAKGGGEVNVTYETIGGRGSGTTTAGAGLGGVVAVRRADPIGPVAPVADTGPEEGVGKGLRLDPVAPEMVAQRLIQGTDDRGPNYPDEEPGMSFSQRAKFGRMRGGRLSESPMSTNVEDRRRIDLSGDPGGLEGTGDLGRFNPDDYDLPNADRRTRWPMRQGPDLGEQLGYGDVGRRSMDQALGADAGIDASAGLDVNVRGPRGVDVKASGDGMFEGNTSVSRQVELQ